MNVASIHDLAPSAELTAVRRAADELYAALVAMAPEDDASNPAGGLTAIASDLRDSARQHALWAEALRRRAELA